MQVKFLGNPVNLGGNEVKVGEAAPEVVIAGKDLEDIVIGKSEKKQIIVAVPSLDTPVCASEARKFNEKAASLPNTEVIVVSMDLPFAMGRFCTTEGIENLRTASDFRAKKFAKSYGILIEDSALAGLNARAIFVISGGVIAYKDIMAEITEEPNYEAVLEAAKNA
ncbi:MAG: thiol peroxidase [Campylobacter sp.]|nr:thiol peroxidase [Campylobacter sp.]